MPGVTYDTFERYRQKGLDARRAGQWDSARVYLLEAARAMVALGKQAQGDELKSAREEMASRLLELARDCDKAQRHNRKPTPSAWGTTSREGASNDGASDTKSADQWIVKERPSVRFDDVAGLDDVKEEIRLKMIYPFAHPELAQRFGIEPG